jgi:hypothetical protein
MIDVRVREDHAVERFWVTAEMRVLGVRLGPPTLEQAAIEKDAEAVGLEQMLTSCDLSCCTVEGDLHT